MPGWRESPRLCRDRAGSLRVSSWVPWPGSPAAGPQLQLRVAREPRGSEGQGLGRAGPARAPSPGPHCFPLPGQPTPKPALTGSMWRQARGLGQARLHPQPGAAPPGPAKAKLGSSLSPRLRPRPPPTSPQQGQQTRWPPVPPAGPTPTAGPSRARSALPRGDVPLRAGSSEAQPGHLCHDSEASSGPLAAELPPT